MKSSKIIAAKRHGSLGIVSSILLLLCSSKIATGHSCGPSPIVCEKINQVEVGFIGTMIEQKWEPHNRWSMIFQVEEAFKGVERDVDKIELNSNSEFELSKKRYLILANRLKGSNIISVGACNTTVYDVEEIPGDIEFLRAWAAGHPVSSIQGFVKANRAESFIPYIRDGGLSGVEISADSEGNIYHATSDAQGKFRIEGIPVGKYKLVASLKGFDSERDTYFVNVSDGRCSHLDIAMWTSNSIVGTVRDQAGNPLLMVQVELVSYTTGGLQCLTTAFSDKQGLFKFTRIPEGDYLLGINIVHPHEIGTLTYYWPGNHSRDQARTISIKGPVHLTGYDLRVIPHRN